MSATTHTISTLTELGREECEQLLGYGSYVGRIGFVAGGRPLIYPVNYIFERGAIYVRTGGSTTLSVLDAADVAFEVDDHRSLEHSGWSVLVRGVLHRVTDEAELDELRRGPLQAWGRPDAHEYLRIDIDTISGRRLNPPSGIGD